MLCIAKVRLSLLFRHVDHHYFVQYLFCLFCRATSTDAVATNLTDSDQVNPDKVSDLVSTGKSR